MNYIILSIVELTNLTQYFPSYERLADAMTSSSYLMQFIVVGLLAPIAEEVVCRGILLNRLCSWMPKWPAVIVGSAIFGLIHFNLFQGLYAFMIGIAFSLLYLRYRNLLIPIIGHIAFNSANIVFRMVLEMTGSEEFNPWIILIPSTVIAFGIILILIKFTKAAKLIEEPEPQQKPGSVLNVPLIYS